MGGKKAVMSIILGDNAQPIASLKCRKPFQGDPLESAMSFADVHMQVPEGFIALVEKLLRQNLN